MGWYGDSRTQWLSIQDELGIIRPELTEPMDEAVFGEGICWLNSEEFIEMTWQEDIAYILDRETLKPKRQFAMSSVWPGVKQGWGITIDEENNLLYISDGTAQITVADARTLEQKSQFTVKNASSQAIRGINELEFVDGFVWANVFGLNYMIKVDPATGYITEAIDCQALYDAEMNYVRTANNNDMSGYDFGNNVFNGIAYNPETKDWYVTGKRWNFLFKIHLK